MVSQDIKASRMKLQSLFCQQVRKYGLHSQVANDIFKDAVVSILNNDGKWVKTYEEATGKTAPGKNLVTLCRREDERAMITLFLLERAWTISPIKPEEKLKTIEKQKMQTSKGAKKEIDTGQVWMCPICGKQHRLVHVETEKAVRHALIRT